MSFSYAPAATRSESQIREMFVQIYAWMTAGLLTTGAVASFTAGSPGMLALIFGNPFMIWVLFIIEIAMVLSIGAITARVSAAAGMAMFLAYAAVNGLTLSSIFLIYTQDSVSQAFFVTAGTFAVMSALGLVIKLDLSRVRNVLYMALVGLLLATVVNMLWANSTLYWIITYAGVAIFVGLTVVDTQKIKEMALEDRSEGLGRVAVIGALTLYLDFVNLFLYLLRILGSRK